MLEWIALAINLGGIAGDIGSCPFHHLFEETAGVFFVTAAYLRQLNYLFWKRGNAL